MVITPQTKFCAETAKVIVGVTTVLATLDPIKHCMTSSAYERMLTDLIKHGKIT